MELLWMILPVFLVCAEAENVTEVKAELGQNVTLTCSVEVSDIYWYMEIHNQLRVQILRTFGKTDDNPSYCDPEFKTKYSVLENRLVITNVTAEDFRCYFCAKKQNDCIHFEGTISLVSDSITPSNVSKTNNNQQRIQGIWQSQTILFSSFALNGLLVLLVIEQKYRLQLVGCKVYILGGERFPPDCDSPDALLAGLCLTSLYPKSKKSKCQVNEPSSPTSGNPEAPQYEEIELRVPPATAQMDCIYYKVQLPHSMLPQH
ncbi:uncharacterized protein LOC121891721 isoform X1 [Thunnus maccoyii]|uniref:uncharacterized protein LOC121891721 isoform X1 n=1 Tax=Thunnus maccoyii TaxID=8240 RepID=UPI001C4D4FF3|nr:uncharacterized protein LOC121891721 isoform X1 [Thunnus maccoyii]